MLFLLSQEIHESQELRQKSSSKILQEDHANLGARFSKVPVPFRARKQIFKSKYKE